MKILIYFIPAFPDAYNDGQGEIDKSGSEAYTFQGLAHVAQLDRAAAS